MVSFNPIFILSVGRETSLCLAIYSACHGLKQSIYCTPSKFGYIYTQQDFSRLLCFHHEMGENRISTPNVAGFDLKLGSASHVGFKPPTLSLLLQPLPQSSIWDWGVLGISNCSLKPKDENTYPCRKTDRITKTVYIIDHEILLLQLMTYETTSYTYR
jgi:hypothetical protein